jgi:hypothetical protein
MILYGSPVKRESSEEHGCLCAFIGPDYFDRCDMTADPDSPFCPDCEDRHPGWMGPAGVTVSAVPPAPRRWSGSSLGEVGSDDPSATPDPPAGHDPS